MPAAELTRRQLLRLSAGTLIARYVPAQSPSLAHVSVATLERERILAGAKLSLTAPVVPVVSGRDTGGSPHLFFSELDSRPTGTSAVFRAQARALRNLCETVATLAAAYLLTSEEPYAARAAEHLRASLLTPATRLEPSFDQAGCLPGTRTGTPGGLDDLVPLAELSRAVTFLVDSPSLAADEQSGLQNWFRAAGDWLQTSHLAQLARDKQDHRASSWLLLASAFARCTRDEAALESCRKLFRAPTLRHQIRADGVFPQEVATPNPYRNTLFNFDLLAAACQLLSSPFDQLWTYELIDGVGLRIVAAWLYPLIAHPERWPYPADADGFRDLPRRRPGLLFAGRAYNRPEYVALWEQLPAGPPPEQLTGSFVLQQPLLWTARAPHGL